MSSGLLASLGINILVGVYFFWFYPRSLRKNFPTGNLPPAFALLSKVVPVIGALLIAGSLIYGLLALTGTLPA